MSQEKTRKRIVGLWLSTTLPDGRLVMIVQLRGLFNWHNAKPESFPGGSQPTVHGGVDSSETFLEALAREVDEELALQITDPNIGEPILVYKEEADSKELEVYTTTVPYEYFREDGAARLHFSSGGALPLFLEDLVTIRVADSSKKEVLTPNDRIAMFKDSFQGLLGAFSQLLCVDDIKFLPFNRKDHLQGTKASLRETADGGRVIVLLYEDNCTDELCHSWSSEFRFA